MSKYLFFHGFTNSAYRGVSFGLINLTNEPDIIYKIKEAIKLRIKLRSKVDEIVIYGNPVTFFSDESLDIFDDVKNLDIVTLSDKQIMKFSQVVSLNFGEIVINKHQVLFTSNDLFNGDEYYCFCDFNDFNNLK